MAGDLTVGQLRIILEADSSKFAAAMKDASADSRKLADTLKKELQPSTRGINAAFKQFLGTNEIRRAQEMAAAVQKLGGVTRLTEADQRKLNASVTGAIAHYKALGQAAPANLLAIQKATMGATTATQGMGGALKTSFGQLTASFTAASLITKAVTGVVDLGRAAVASAGQIVDLSKKTGLSIDGVQRLGFVAKQSGGSIEQMADAVFKTGIQIEKGGSKTKKALTDLGLSFAELRAMKPEAQFDAIMRALSSINDPQERNRIGVELMGKAYANVAASVDGYVEALENAPVANADAIRATDEAADAIERAWDQAEKAAVNAIGGILMAWERGDKAAADASSGVEQRLRALNAIGVPDWLGKIALGTVVDPQTPRTGAFGKDVNLGAQSSGLKNYTRELKEAQAEVAALTKEQREQIKAALKLGESTEEISNAMEISERSVELFKDSLKGAGKDVDAYRKKIQDAAKVFTGAKLQERVKELADVLKEVGGTSNLSGQALVDFAKSVDLVKRQGGNLTPELKAARDWFFLFRDAVKNTRVELELMNRAQGSLAMMQFLGSGPAAQRRDTQQKRDVFNDLAAKGPLPGTMLVSLQNQIDLKQLDLAGKETDEWADATRDVVDAFEQLANISDGTMSQIARLMGVSVASALMFRDAIGGMSGALKGTNNNWAAFTTNAANAVAAIAQMGASFEASTDNVNLKDNVLGGGASGAAIGGAIVPGWGHIIGFTVGAIAGKLRNQDARRAIDEVAKDTGIQISDGLAKAIQDRGNERGGGQLNRWVAEVLSLGDIVKEAGGVTKRNFDEIAKQFFQAQTFLGEGTISVEEFGETADEVFPQLAQHAVRMGGIWTEQFAHIVNEIKRSGVEVQGFKELIDNQLGQASGGLNQVVGGFVGGLPKDSGGTGPEADAKRKQIVAESQDDFDRLSRIALAAFNAYIANGQSAADAISAIGPSIDNLQQATTDFGFAGNAAFDQLARWQDLVSANQPLLDQLGGLNEMMVALANVGALDAQTFADMQAQGLSTFQSLTDAGFSQTEALAQMKPLLETLRNLHTERGFAIDEETQGLIDQAEAHGILAKETIDGQEVMLDLLAAQIELAGGTLPESYRKYKQEALAANQAVAASTTDLANKVTGELGSAVSDDTVWNELETKARAAFDEAERIAREAAGGVEDAFKDIYIPPIEVPVSFDVENQPRIDGDSWADLFPGFATGGVGDFGDGTLAMLHGKEWIIPDDDMRQLVDDWNKGPSMPDLSLGASVPGVQSWGGDTVASGSGTPVYLTIDGRVMGEILLPTMLETSQRLGITRV